jgi:6-pyruvoyltetrahydropterin/6-carboxytetrahydropterin synthase
MMENQEANAPQRTYRASFNRTFQAAHRLADEPGKCSRIHGHNFDVAISVATDAVTQEGFTVNFYHVKEFIDRFDHKLVLHEDDPMLEGFEQAMPQDWIIRVPVPPSTENFAHFLAEELAHVVANENQDTSFAYVAVLLRETDSIAAQGEFTVERDADQG